MATPIVIPSLGESIKEARILRWFKKDGEYVNRDESVLEIETDKATENVAAAASGVVRISTQADAVVAVGAVVGQIEEGAQPAKAQASAASKEAPREAPKPAPAAASEAPILSPAAQRIVAEQKLDPAKITGTAPGGRITKEDVLTAVESAKAPAPVNGPPTAKPEIPAGQRETRQRMTMIRQRIGERLVESQRSTATLTTFNEADMSAVMELRTRYKEKFDKKHGVGLGFMSFFVKAVIEALHAFPMVNARLDGNEIVYQHFYDIGVAVSTERGLMVPILRNADQLSFASIEKKITELAVKARDNKISTSDLQGGTFTITNGGTFGSLLSTPILNPPQTAILGMHAIQKRAMVVNDQIVIRPMMYLALSYDHRLIDGREAVQFLVRVKECVENPERMLLDI